MAGEVVTVTKPRSWWSILGSILLPWVIIAYVYWIGPFWTMIGMAGCYVAALLVAIGALIADTKAGRV